MHEERIVHYPSSWWKRRISKIGYGQILGTNPAALGEAWMVYPDR